MNVIHISSWALLKSEKDPMSMSLYTLRRSSMRHCPVNDRSQCPMLVSGVDPEIGLLMIFLCSLIWVPMTKNTNWPSSSYHPSCVEHCPGQWNQDFRMKNCAKHQEHWLKFYGCGMKNATSMLRLFASQNPVDASIKQEHIIEEEEEEEHIMLCTGLEK